MITKKPVYFICFSFMLIAAIASAQDMNLDISPATQSNVVFYKTYAKGWVIRPNMGFKQFSFSIENKASGRKLQFVPNVGLGIGCKGIYKGYGLGYTFAIPTPDDPTRGDSTYQDFQFTFPFGRHGFDITFQNYKGFYVKDEALKALNGGNYVQYPDMAGALIELRYYYAFNRDFSMKAAFTQTEKQLEDAGSWLIGSSLNAFIVSQSGGFIPAPYVLEFPEILGLDAMTFIGLSVSGGYTYTWAYSNDWFLTPSLMFGTNFQRQTYYILGGEYKQTVPFNPKISFKLSVGKHVDNYYFGASLVQNSMIAATSENIQFTGSTLNFNIYCGIRL